MLDDEYVRSLGSSFDVVYSWGVLHHTGSMWKAIRNALSLVADRGWFYAPFWVVEWGSRPPFASDVSRLPSHNTSI